MANFGFTPGDSDGSEEPVDFAAMMAQMQQQIQEQFSTQICWPCRTEEQPQKKRIDW